jgi:hypothetical protein
LYSSPKKKKIIGTIKSRTVRLVGHVARMMRSGMNKAFWWENQKARDQQEDPDVSGRRTIRRFLEKQERVMWTGFIWPVAGSCEHGNEPSSSIKF